MANSLGPTPDKKEQIARWTAFVEKYEREIARLEKDGTPSIETHKRIATLKRIVAEYQLLIKDNMDFIAAKDRRDRELYNRFMRNK